MSFQSWDHLIPLDQWFLSSTLQWTNPTWRSKGVPIAPAPPRARALQRCLQQGLGGPCRLLMCLGQLDELSDNMAYQQTRTQGCSHGPQGVPPSPERQTCSSVHRQHYCCLLCEQTRGARSIPLSTRVEQILLWCQANILLSARHILGKINIVVDSLSRSHIVLQTEWTLSPEALRLIWDIWHRPMVDLFATRFNHRLETYVSPVPDPGAWAVDALSLSWSPLLSYAFPPFPLLGKVIRKARMEQASFILIAPKWPAQLWFPDLLGLTHLPPLQLSLGPRSLLQPRSSVPHAHPQFLSLHANGFCAGLDAITRRFGAHCLPPPGLSQTCH